MTTLEFPSPSLPLHSSYPNVLAPILVLSPHREEVSSSPYPEVPLCGFCEILALTCLDLKACPRRRWWSGRSRGSAPSPPAGDGASRSTGAGTRCKRRTGNAGLARRIAAVCTLSLSFSFVVKLITVKWKKYVKILEISDKEAKEKEKAAQQLAVPRLSVCADAQKVDRAKLAQTEVNFN